MVNSLAAHLTIHYLTEETRSHSNEINTVYTDGVMMGATRYVCSYDVTTRSCYKQEDKD